MVILKRCFFRASTGALDVAHFTRAISLDILINSPLRFNDKGHGLLSVQLPVLTIGLDVAESLESAVLDWAERNKSRLVLF